MTSAKPIPPEADVLIDQLVDLALSPGPLPHLTDKYFSHTARIAAEKHPGEGAGTVAYAVFLRKRVIAALEPAIRLVRRLVPEAKITRCAEEGTIVPSEQKLLEVEGPLAALSEVETLLLQKIGFPCVAALNAYEMCRAVPGAGFLDMHARHGSGAEMNLLAAYGAAVGAFAAKAANGAVTGFIGSSQDLTAPFFGQEKGMGTMPHALIGLEGGDAVKALQSLMKVLPDGQAAIVLVDYRGLEVTDALAAARWFYEEAGLGDSGRVFGVRLDTHGARFPEGLDYETSVEIVGAWLDVAGEYNIVETVLGERAVQLDPENLLIDRVRRYLFGTGVSVAAIIHTRKCLDAAGYKQAKIVASSGFNPQKCLVTGAVRAPVDVIGTGSFLPATLSETYATADIIRYDGRNRVKLGREFLWD